jgi:hypothetical protein
MPILSGDVRPQCLGALVWRFFLVARSQSALSLHVPSMMLARADEVIE